MTPPRSSPDEILRTPSPDEIPRTSFLDCAFDLLTFEGALGWLRGRGADDRFGYVTTPNVDHLVRAHREPELFRPLYRDAALCLCDSRVLARVGQACGVTLTVVPGSDLTRALFEQVLDAGDRVCVVGGSEASVARLRAIYPRVGIVHCPAPMGLRTNADALAATAAAAQAAGEGVRFWLLSVGSPQQEMLARRMADLPGIAGTALCIGASIDFLTGDQRRAPRAVQRLSLEWAWRLATEPRRLARRYLVEGPAIFPIAYRWARRRRRG